MFSERADIHMLKSGMKEVWVAYRFYPVGFSRFINFPKFSSSYTKVIDIFLVMNYKFPFTFSNFSQVSPNFRPIWSKTIFLQDFQISPYKIGNIMTFFSVRILINFPQYWINFTQSKKDFTSSHNKAFSNQYFHFLTTYISPEIKYYSWPP